MFQWYAVMPGTEVALHQTNICVLLLVSLQDQACSSWLVDAECSCNSQLSILSRCPCILAIACHAFSTHAMTCCFGSKNTEWYVFWQFHAMLLARMPWHLLWVKKL